LIRTQIHTYDEKTWFLNALEGKEKIDSGPPALRAVYITCISSVSERAISHTYHPTWNMCLSLTNSDTNDRKTKRRNVVPLLNRAVSAVKVSCSVLKNLHWLTLEVSV